jgi:hypothetical protein
MYSFAKFLADHLLLQNREKILKKFPAAVRDHFRPLPAGFGPEMCSPLPALDVRPKRTMGQMGFSKCCRYVFWSV